MKIESRFLNLLPRERKPASLVIINGDIV